MIKKKKAFDNIFVCVVAIAHQSRFTHSYTCSFKLRGETNIIGPSACAINFRACVVYTHKNRGTGDRIITVVVAHSLQRWVSTKSSISHR